MTCLCGHRGFAGPSACVLEKGHEGDHEYGDYQQALAIAAAKELHSLRDQLAAAQAERDEYRIKHEVACSTLELVKERRDAVQRALAAQCKHTKDLEAERDELQQHLDTTIDVLNQTRVERGKLKFALENVHLFAAKNRKEDWALLILGFCAEGGVVGSVTR